MAITRTLTAPGTLTLNDSHTTAPGDSPPLVVGGPAEVWSDNSDASYADLDTFENPEVAYADTARTALVPVPVSTDATTATVSAWVRYQSMSADMAPPTVVVRRASTGTDLLSAYPTGPGSSSATWVEIPLAEVAAGRLGTFLSLINDGVETVDLVVGAPFLFAYTMRNSRTRIYEAYLVVSAPGVAPPCRLFPRGDGLGVGSGRHFPPPKSQQRSGRRFGYY